MLGSKHGAGEGHHSHNDLLLRLLFGCLPTTGEEGALEDGFSIPEPLLVPWLVVCLNPLALVRSWCELCTCLAPIGYLFQRITSSWILIWVARFFF